MAGNGIRVEQGAKRVRVMLGGVVVADTASTLLVWEKPYFPTYYFPTTDVRTDLLAETGETRSSPSRGSATVYAVKAGGGKGRAYAYPEPRIDELAEHVAFDWETMDNWFEEDEEVYVHPRDPYTRVDILRSGRRVRVEIDGVTVADSTAASFVFETGLPTRYYLPKTDVLMEMLTPTDTVTSCPYKGNARYWSATVEGTEYPDIAWAYDFPASEAQKIAGLVSFYTEKVDIYLDEALQPRPKSPFS